MGENVWEPRTGLIDETTKDDEIAGKPELCAMTNFGDVTCNSEGHAENKGNNANFNHVHLIIPEDGVKSNSHGNVNIDLPHVCPDTKSSIISFRNVNYEVDVPSRELRSCCRSKEKQYIVKDASGVFGPGVNAILGPTGSGKTSLLDILAGRKNRKGLSGEVLVNGSKQPSNYKCMIGYVIQDDMVMGMLTVKENIEFSASLRLPSGTSTQKRKERVEEIISDLGLSKCANTKIGTEFQRGVSGGERKRTNIAMELITSPPVLFLDEPTTGLDSYTAHSVMFLLKRLSHRGMTIIMSIHQPRYSIFKLFDTMMLMSGGECVFYGPAKDGLQHFQSGNYVCEDHNNPPDFFLDVLSGCIPSSVPLTTKERLDNGREPDDDGNSVKANGINKDLETDGFLVESEGKDSAVEIQRSLVSLYRSSEWYQKLESEITVIHESKSSAVGDVDVVTRVSYPTSPVRQMAIVSSRTWHNMIRNRHALLTQMFTAIILGLIVGSIYFRVDDSCSTGIENRIGAFFFIVMNYVFGNMSAVDIFIKERAIFVHETLSGFYRVSVYFFAKLFCDVTPQRVFPIMLFAVISYFMIGFQLACDKFMFYLLNIILTSLSGTAVALMFSASTRQHTIGTVFTALVWVCMMVFSGRMVNLETIPHWLQWLKWLSIFRYSMNAFMINELKGFECTVTSNTTFYRCTSGDECLTMYSVPHETTWDLWSNELALFLLASGFLVLTYIQLRRAALLK